MHWSSWIHSLFLVGFTCFIYLTSFHEFLQFYSFYQFGETQKILPCYDYIIVGSGTAGSTLALRLSEDGKSSVLLLEAGVYSNFLHAIPSVGPLLHASGMDWQYKTEPQSQACGALNNNVSNWPAGRAYGGCGRLNNMIYVRGHRKDFNMWYVDKKDYNYNTDVFEYFKKSENNVGRNKEARYHYTGGPVIVDDLPYVTPLAKAVLESADILGYSSRDINGQYHTGFMVPQVNLKDGKRWTVSDELLHLKSNRPNLHILTGSHVTKVLFKGYHEIYGVVYNRFGNSEIAVANKGVILSAGAIGSPKLLLLSGVGPEDHLNSLGIHMRVNLPVGDNLQDHITTGLDLVILNQTLPYNIFSLVSPSSAWDYFFRGKGPWTAVGCEVVGIPEKYEFNKSPKIQLAVMPAGMSADGGLHIKKSLNIKEDVWEKYFKPLIGQQTISIVPILLHPKSKGTVRLRSTDPYDIPIIDPKYLTHKDDVNSLIEGIRLVAELINTEPLAKFGAQLNTRQFPGCDHYEWDTTDYWECYIRHFTLTSFHPVGTCKMGHELDPTAVVDFNFKVKGVDKLYVADASVMPTETSGNINAAVAMVAERLADLLLKKQGPVRTNILDLFVTKTVNNVC